jgi:hypothetical protein
MNFTRKITTTIAAVAVISGVGFGATAANAAPAPTAVNTSVSPEIPVTVDPVAIGDAIAKATKSAANRDGFVRDVSYQAFYNAGGQQYNVVVMNLSQDHDPSGLRGVVGYSDATYDGVVYGVWIFEEGTFVNNGDGGYINWAAYGLIDRVSDSTMVFAPHS